ncbi:MAG: hypothetical protein AABZ15_10600 [Nitrospirota bacterium]
MRKVPVFLVLAVGMLQFACGGGGGGGATPQGRGSNTLFLAVKDTTPAFAATVSAAPKMKSGIFSAATFTDPAMNLAFQLLRNYTYPADEGKIDMTNIYKVLFEAGGYLDDAPMLCSSMSLTADSFISSYAFSDFLNHSYNCGGTRAESGGYGTSVAYQASGSDKYMLATYKWAPTPASQITIGAIQAHFDSTTKDVQLTFAQTVSYPPSGGFVTRTTISGNSATHAFELKIALDNGSGTGKSIVGKGVSQGAGQYFLMRDGANYYCLPAGATETDLRSIAPTVVGDVSVNCTTYVAAVAALTQYDVTNAAHMPNLDLSSFDLGVAGTPKKYLMFP